MSTLCKEVFISSLYLFDSNDPHVDPVLKSKEINFRLKYISKHSYTIKETTSEYIYTSINIPVMHKIMLNV